MRRRLRRKRNADGAALTIVERHRRSRRRTMERIVRTMRASGAIRRAHMPSPRTVERWVADDADFAERYAAGLSAQTHALTASLIAAVDCGNPDSRRRATALRGRIAARRQWLTLHAKRMKGEPATASRGISAEGVALLEKAASPFAAPISSSGATDEDASPGYDRSVGNDEMNVSDETPPSLRDHGQDDTPSYAPEDERYRSHGEMPDGPVAGGPFEEGRRFPITPAEEKTSDAPHRPRPTEGGIDRSGNGSDCVRPGTWTVRFDLDAPRGRSETIFDSDLLG